MTWTALIVDDEPLARKNLEIMLAGEADLRLLPSAANAMEAGDVLREKRVDLLFLDIRMPGRSGIDLLRELQEAPRVPFVVLVTAFDRYAIEAFELDARDYLVKPFGEDRLQKTLRRAREQLGNSNAQDLARLAAFAEAGDPARLTLEVDGDLMILKPDEIAWVEAADHYLIIHSAHGRPILRKPLRDFEKLVPSFARIHRSTLVNPAHVTRCRRAPLGGGMVELRDGTVLNVSRRRWKEVRSGLQRSD